MAKKKPMKKAKDIARIMVCNVKYDGEEIIVGLYQKDAEDIPKSVLQFLGRDIAENLRDAIDSWLADNPDDDDDYDEAD